MADITTQFTYYRGEWKENTSLLKWEEDEDFEVWIVRCGFKNHSSRYGNAGGSNIEYYEHENGAFLAVVTPFCNTWYIVLLPDFPSLMMFMRDFAPAFLIFDVATIHEEMQSSLNKLFQAYHGHDASSICQKCDPDEYKRRKEHYEKTHQNK